MEKDREMEKELKEELEKWEKNYEEKLAEKEGKIQELEHRVKELEEMLGKKGSEESRETQTTEEGSERPESNQRDKGETAESWGKVFGRRVLKEALGDRKVQRQITHVTEEVKEKRTREKNLIVNGWGEVEKEGVSGDDLKDANKVAKVIIENCLKGKVEAESAEFYGNGEKKSLVIRMKSREERNELMLKTGNLKGTSIYVEEGKDIEIRRVELDKKDWDIVTVYNRKGNKETLEKVKGIIENRENREVLAGGEWNLHIGKRGGWDRNFNEVERKTMDTNSEKEGEELVDAMSSCGMLVLNGNMKGDENGEFTFVGKRGETVIDYVWVDAEAIKKIKDFRVEMIGGSDHLPLVTEVEGKKLERKRKKKEKKIVEIWSDEAVAKFRESCGNLVWEGNDTDEKLEDLIEKVSKCVVKKEIKVRERGHHDWWNKECEKKSRELKNCLRKKRTKKAKREDVLRLRKELEEAKERARDEQERLWEEKIGMVKNENDMWNLIAKERKKKEGISDKISGEEWRKHFMNLFEREELNGERKV